MTSIRHELLRRKSLKLHAQDVERGVHCGASATRRGDMEKEKDGEAPTEPERVVELYPAPPEPEELSPIQLEVMERYLEVSRQLSELMRVIQKHWSAWK